MRPRNIRSLPILLAPALCATAFFLAAGCQKQREIPPEVAQMIQATVEVKTLPASLKDQKERVRAWEEMRRFYEKRQFQPAWFTPRGPKPQAQELLASIDGMAREGLDPRRYRKEKLAGMLRQVGEKPSLEDPAAQRYLAHADMSLTYTFLTLGAHLASGRQQPGTLRIDWYTKPRNVDLDVRLEKALSEKGTVQEVLRSYTPPGEDYARLRDVLARYRQIAANGGWPAVPEGKLKKGSQGEAVRVLRARLRAEGDLPGAATQNAASPQDAVFDDALAAAVARFQKRHGFDPTGSVDADTLAELNVPVQRRIRQIEVNLERWRWLPNTFGDRYIRVNIPEFAMQVVDHGQTALAMRVVVGKAQQNRTPVFSDKMTYLELNPTWNIPPEIASEEILPKLASDPGYLDRHNMERVEAGGSTRIRQRAGADNPLGQVKFMFPNEFDIYLHDTPADHLFKEEERDFSHGCIRLERPLDLARYLLQGDPDWTPEKLQEAIASGETQSVTLPKPLPVHILYFTAWVDKDGTVQLRRDVYGHDAKLAAALADEPIVDLDLDAIRGQVRAEKKEAPAEAGS
jgi:L,D-transpeptidase YcbB